MSSRDQPRELDPGAVRALAHPLRVQLYDALAQYGAQTASTLASMTGESSGATSYHLRALAKHGLIREVPDRGTARERWWEVPRGPVSYSIHPDQSPSERASTQLLMSESLTRRHQQLLNFAMNDFVNEDPEWRDASRATTSNLRLTAAQLTDLADRVRAVIDEAVERYTDQDREGTRPVSIRADFFPLPEIGE